MISSKFQFEDDGSILFDRDVTIDDCLVALRQKLAMFLKRIESYPRTSAGDYSRVSPRLGSLDAAGVLWEEVLAIAGVLQALTYREGDHILTRRDGSRPAPALRVMETRRTLKPLAELARELTFSILYEGGQFPCTIDRATIEKLECVAREINLVIHDRERSSYSPERTSTEGRSYRHEEVAIPATDDNEVGEFAAEDIINSAFISEMTFRRYIDDARVSRTKERGLAARRRRFTRSELSRIREAASAGSRSTRTRVLEAIDKALTKCSQQCAAKAPNSTNAPLLSGRLK